MRRLERFARYLQSNWGAFPKKGGAELVFNCPACGDTKQHFSFNVDLGVSNCFRCGYRPRPQEFLKRYTMLSDSEINELLEYNECSNVKGVESPVMLPRDFCLLERYSSEDGVYLLVARFARESNVEMDSLIDYGVGISPSFSGMLIFPCFSFEGELLSWFGRAYLSVVEPRYYFCGSKSRTLWGILHARLIDGQLFVCEGWKDAYRMGGVCIFGNAISSEQVLLARQLKQRLGGDVIAVMLDSDAWKYGIGVAKRFLDAGENHVNLYFLSGKKDPGECKNYQEAIENSICYRLPEQLLHANLRIRKENKSWIWNF